MSHALRHLAANDDLLQIVLQLQQHLLTLLVDLANRRKVLVLFERLLRLEVTTDGLIVQSIEFGDAYDNDNVQPQHNCLL